MKLKLHHKKWLILLLFLQTLIQAAYSQKTITLEEVLNPRFINISDERLYIAEKYSVHIYLKKDFSFVTTFGRNGEGPGEFRLVTGLTSGKHFVTVSDPGKIHVFSSSGKFIKDLKSPAYCLHYAPIGNKYIGSDSLKKDNTHYYSINLFDSNLKKEKELYRYERLIQNSGKIDIIRSEVNFYVSNDRIFINGLDDRIHCFDENGNRVRILTIDAPSVNVSEEFKDNYIDALRNHKKLRNLYQIYKSRIKFPKHFPLIRYLRVNNNKIYIITFKQMNHNHECYVLDFSGTILKKTALPIQFKDIRNPYPFDIYDNSFYQVVENEYDGPAKLCVTPIR